RQLVVELSRRGAALDAVRERPTIPRQLSEARGQLATRRGRGAARASGGRAGVLGRVPDAAREEAQPRTLGRGRVVRAGGRLRGRRKGRAQQGGETCGESEP